MPKVDKTISFINEKASATMTSGSTIVVTPSQQNIGSASLPLSGDNTAIIVGMAMILLLVGLVLFFWNSPKSK